VKIALITHNIVRGDGQGRVNYEIVRRLAATGVHFTLLAERVAPDLLAAARQGSIEWIRIRPLLNRPVMAKVWQFANRVDRIIERLRPRFDLIVGNGFVLRRPHNLSICNFVHASWRQARAAQRPWWSGPNAAYQSVYTACNLRWERAAFSAARVVVAISDPIRHALLQIGIPDDRIRVIPNGVDLDEFRPTPRLSPQDVGIPSPPPGDAIALFVGDIRSARKNLDSVLRALARVPRLRLAVVGRVEGSPFPALAKQLGVGDRVTFLGYRQDVAAIMRACDLFVFPSRYEPFGLVVLEAMACGLPVITAATVGCANLVADCCGRVIPDPDDVNALAGAMSDLSLDADLASRMGAAARRAAESYGWQHMADRYAQLFQELADHRNPARARAASASKRHPPRAGASTAPTAASSSVY
jgi:glycosyltransferase involved in cell wall biosynthesis